MIVIVVNLLFLVCLTLASKSIRFLLFSNFHLVDYVFDVLRYICYSLSNNNNNHNNNSSSIINNKHRAKNDLRQALGMGFIQKNIPR